MDFSDSTKSIIKGNAVLNGLKYPVIVYRCIEECSDFIIVDINDIAESVDHIIRDEVIGRKITEVFSGAREFGLFETIKRVCCTGVPEHIEIKNYKNGRIVGWRENDILKLETGEVVAVYNNKTHQKHVELALKESEKRYQSIIATSIDGFIMMDNNGYIIDMNASLTKISGYERQDLIGQKAFEVFLPAKKNVYRKFAQRVEENTHFLFETRLINKDGQLVDVEISANKSEDRQYVYCFVRDYSERKQKEADLLYVGYHDKLTGLYNRFFFEEEVKRLDNPRHFPISFIIADVNGLKFANDAFGHQFGDSILQKIAVSIRACLRKDEIVARWGGDEFVIILPETPYEKARKICERINELTEGETVGPVGLSVALGCATKDQENQDFAQTIKEAENQMYQNKLLNTKSGRSETVSSLRKTMYEMNYETEEHEQRMLGIANQIGHKLDLMAQEIEELKLLATLHDLGKLGISKDILTKTSGLSPVEWEEIRRHSEIGYRIAESIPGLAHISKYILSVHERWDGQGYPRGLKGNAIPKLSRIIAIVDAYDAMVSGRPYKEAITSQEAVAELIRCSGTQFDPQLIDLFIKLDIV